MKTEGRFIEISFNSENKKTLYTIDLANKTVIFSSGTKEEQVEHEKIKYDDPMAIFKQIARVLSIELNREIK